MRPSYWLIRLLPLFAAAMGLVGLFLPGRPHLPIVAGLLFGSAVALEFGGWANASRTHAKSLGTAALVGAVVGAAILVAMAPTFGSPVDLIALR